MSLNELLSKGLVEKFQSDKEQVKNEIEIACFNESYSNK